MQRAAYCGLSQQRVALKTSQAYSFMVSFHSTSNNRTVNTHELSMPLNLFNDVYVEIISVL